MIKAVLKTDGGSRGNPGVAGLGFVLFNEWGEPTVRGGWYLPHATNNVAEYSALIWGLKNAHAAGIDTLEVYADSELMVKQMKGEYRVKSPDLKPLYMQARELLAQFDCVSIAHIYRESNKDADLAANEAMDTGGSIGNFLVAWTEQQPDLFSAMSDDVSYDEKADLSIGHTRENVASKEDDRLSYSTLADLSIGHVMESLREELHDIATNISSHGGETVITSRKVPAMQKNEPYQGSYKLSGETYEAAGGHYEMTIKDHFDASHALPGYDGPCQYLHGHTWEIEVTVAGEHLDSVGILYDFKALKGDLHGVLDNFDHRHINDAPPFDIINPTAENLARIIFFEVEKTLPSGISLQQVVVWESPAAKVVFRP